MRCASKEGTWTLQNRFHSRMNSLRKFFHSMNRFMVWMWKTGWGKWINFWPAGLGRIMVIKHRGRRSGKEYLTPVNYAIVDGEVYCTAGFGSISDWYRNMLVNPQVELWLPDGKHAGCAEDISEFAQAPVPVAAGDHCLRICSLCSASIRKTE